LTGHTYTDTLADDTFADVSGTLSTVDRDVGDSATYSIDAGVAGSYLAGAYDSAKAGTYGTLYLNSTSGAYKFVANDAAIEGLNAGNNPSLGFTLKVTDGGGLSDTQTLTVNISGANDKPRLEEKTTGHKSSDTLADHTFPEERGTLSTVDRDVGDSATYSIDAGVAGSYLAGAYDSAKAGTYGTLYLNSTSGAYYF